MLLFRLNLYVVLFHVVIINVSNISTKSTFLIVLLAFHLIFIFNLNFIKKKISF